MWSDRTLLVIASLRGFVGPLRRVSNRNESNRHHATTLEQRTRIRTNATPPPEGGSYG